MVVIGFGLVAYCLCSTVICIRGRSGEPFFFLPYRVRNWMYLCINVKYVLNDLAKAHLTLCESIRIIINCAHRVSESIKLNSQLISLGQQSLMRCVYIVLYACEMECVKHSLSDIYVNIYTYTWLACCPFYNSLILIICLHWNSQMIKAQMKETQEIQGKQQQNIQFHLQLNQIIRKWAI